MDGNAPSSRGFCRLSDWMSAAAVLSALRCASSDTPQGSASFWIEGADTLRAIPKKRYVRFWP